MAKGAAARPRMYLEEPTYIRNGAEVIFEQADLRLVFSPDIATFHVVHDAVAVDKNGAYYRGSFIKTDPTDAIVVGEMNHESRALVWKTKNKVFFADQEIVGADAASFSTIDVFNGGCFRDKSSVYYGDKKIAEADPESFVLGICEPYDKHYVYDGAAIKQFKGEKLRAVNHRLVKTETMVYSTCGQDHAYPAIDVASLQPLSRYYARDKHQVYFEENPIPQLDIHDLANLRVFDQINSRYITDGKHVYAGSGRVVNADAKTFGMVPHTDIYFDKTGIYENQYINQPFVWTKLPFHYTLPFDGNELKNDRRSFMMYYRNQLYDRREKTIIENAQEGDLATYPMFLRSDGIHSPDVKTLAFNGATTFTPIANGIIRVDGKLYWNNVPLTGVDAATFAAVDPVNLFASYFRDDHHVYTVDEKRQQLVVLAGARPNTFRTFESGFAADDKTVFFAGHAVAGITGTNPELLAIFAGYRMGCGEDTNGPTDIFSFKTSTGYWELETTTPFKITKLGSKLPAGYFAVVPRAPTQE